MQYIVFVVSFFFWLVCTVRRLSIMCRTNPAVIKNRMHRVSKFLRDTIPIYHRVTIPFQSRVIGLFGFGSRVVRGWWWRRYISNSKGRRRISKLFVRYSWQPKSITERYASRTRSSQSMILFIIMAVWWGNLKYRLLSGCAKSMHF